MLTALLMSAMSPPALALGGSFAGGVGLEPPASGATQVAITQASDRTVLTVTARAAEDIEVMAWLWPAPGYVANSLRQPDPEALERIEAFTQPRVESLTCEELITETRYRTVPGCASYEVPEVERAAEGEAAVGVVPLDAVTASIDFELVSLAADEVDTWLADRELALTASVRAGLESYVLAGVPFVAAYYPTLVPRGAWLPPVRFELTGSPAQIVLPLSGFASEAVSNHELYVYTLTDDPEIDPTVPNYEPLVIPDECQLPEGFIASEWFDDEAARFEAGEDARWLRVHSSAAASCAPCAGEPLRQQDLTDLGAPQIPPAQARVGRLFFQYSPGQLSVDPIVSFTEPAEDASLLWYEAREGLGFAFPVCREDVDPLDVCPNLETEATRGCVAAPGGAVGGWAGGAAAMALLGLLGLRRRRGRAPSGLLLGLAGVLGVAAAPSPAHAIDDGFLDKRPRWEAMISAGLAGTDRVRLDTFRRAGPSPSRPFLGVLGRFAFWGWKDGANFGLVAGLRGWRGSPPPAGGVGEVRFTLIEPSVGVDVRHGMLRRSGLSPFVRYGGRLVVPIMNPDTSGPQALVSGLLHLGAGVWIGKPDDRAWWPTVELRLTAIPRTDGIVTEFHPDLGLPSFTFFPGTANLQLMLGVGFR